MNRVVVVGGSIAGLAAAASVAAYAQEVVIVERRPDPGEESIAPQGAQPHALLQSGAKVLDELFPGLTAELLARGADGGGPDPRRLPYVWRVAGVVREYGVVRPGTPFAFCSRALIETQLRRRVLALPNVEAVHDTASELVVADGRVRGVVLREGGHVDADLVIDAAGRHGTVASTMDRWGLPAPPVTEVGIDLHYTCYHVERRPEDLGEGRFLLLQHTADIPRSGIALPIEDGSWHVAMAGYFGVRPPADPAGAKDFAATLAGPELVDLLSRPFLRPPRRYAYTSSLWRRWERNPVPGLVAIGDSVASFNPVYGQGMSSALLQASALGTLVAHEMDLTRLSTRAARAAARIVANPWQIATGADFMYARTRGRRQAGTAQVNAYVHRVQRASVRDDHVNLVLGDVVQMMAPPARLFAPDVSLRVLRSAAKERRSRRTRIRRSGSDLTSSSSVGRDVGA